MSAARTVAHLFAGCGTGSLGFADAGFDAVFAQESNGLAAETYARNFPSTVLASHPLEYVPAEAVPQADVLFASPSCVGGVAEVSVVLRSRFAEAVRIAEAVQPLLVVFDLPADPRVHRNRDAVHALAERLGYTTSAHMLNSADFGSHVRKKRLFLIGTRATAPLSAPLPTHGEHGSLQPRVTLGDQLERGAADPWSLMHDFPADFALCGPRHEVAAQVGGASSVLLARALALAVRTYLESTDKPS